MQRDRESDSTSSMRNEKTSPCNNVGMSLTWALILSILRMLHNNLLSLKPRAETTSQSRKSTVEKNTLDFSSGRTLMDN